MLFWGFALFCFVNYWFTRQAVTLLRTIDTFTEFQFGDDLCCHSKWNSRVLCFTESAGAFEEFRCDDKLRQIWARWDMRREQVWSLIVTPNFQSPVIYPLFTFSFFSLHFRNITFTFLDYLSFYPCFRRP